MFAPLSQRKVLHGWMGRQRSSLQDELATLPSKVVERLRRDDSSSSSSAAAASGGPTRGPTPAEPSAEEAARRQAELHARQLLRRLRVLERAVVLMPLSGILSMAGVGYDEIVWWAEQQIVVDEAAEPGQQLEAAWLRETRAHIEARWV